jgi:hypothetical protein
MKEVTGEKVAEEAAKEAEGAVEDPSAVSEL